MPPERGSADDPREWLRHARSHLAIARAGSGAPGAFYEHLCFEAQQAAEKALKAVLVSRRIPFPKTHVLSDLLVLLHQGGVEVPEEIRRAAILTPYAISTRYPGLAEALTEGQYFEALELAERVLRWAESLIPTGVE